MIRLTLAIVLLLSGSAFAADGARGTMDLPVLSRDLKPGDVIASEDIAIASIDAARAPRDVITDETRMLGQTPRRRLRAGQPLRESDLRSPIVIRKGSVVTLVYEAPGLTLTVSGRALKDGGIGEVIEIVNSQSRRTIEARVVNANLAAVDPRATLLSAVTE